MKKHLRLIILVIVLMLASTACVRLRRTSDSNDQDQDKTIITRSEQLSDFSSIEFSGVGPITIIQGDTHSIQIEGPRWIVDKMTITVRDNKLIVDSKRDTWRWFTDVNYPVTTITLSNLENLTFEGGGDLTMNDFEVQDLTIVLEGGVNMKMLNLKANLLDLTLRGGVDLTATGAVQRQTVKVEGGTDYNAENLKSEDAVLHLEGATSATVWATTSLDLNLTGAYSVKYYGNPAITQDVDGVGSIDGLGEK